MIDFKPRKNAWVDSELQDIFGVNFQVGDKVARAGLCGRVAELSIATVTRIENDKLYLDGSKVAIKYPGRLLIITSLYLQNEIPNSA